MSKEKPHGQYGCFVDDYEGDTCVFDEIPLRVHDCGIASTLHANGKGRNDCPHWLQIQSDELAALRARVASLEEHGTKLLEACECADFMGDLTEHVSGDLMFNFRRALEEK